MSIRQYVSSSLLVLSTRTIRTLPSDSRATHPRALAPPAGLTKFVDRTLGLRSGAANTKSKGWERKSGEHTLLHSSQPFPRGCSADNDHPCLLCSEHRRDETERACRELRAKLAIQYSRACNVLYGSRLQSVSGQRIGISACTASGR